MTELEFFLMALSIALFLSWVVGLLVWKSKEKDYQQQINAWIKNTREAIERHNRDFRKYLRKQLDEESTTEPEDDDKLKLNVCVNGQIKRSVMCPIKAKRNNRLYFEVPEFSIDLDTASLVTVEVPFLNDKIIFEEPYKANTELTFRNEINYIILDNTQK